MKNTFLTLIFLFTSVLAYSQLNFNVTTTSSENNSCTGTAQINFISGTAPYTFMWGNGITAQTQTAANLCPGNYSVTVTDMTGDSQQANFIIADSMIFHVETTLTYAGLCVGSATVVIEDGVGPFTFYWTGSGQTEQTEDSLCAGSHSVLVTDAVGSQVEYNFNIEYGVNSEPLAVNCTVNQHDLEENCSGVVSVYITGGQPVYSLDINGEVTTLEGGMSNGAMCAGIYTVTVTDAAGQEVYDEFVILGGGDIYQDTNNTDNPPSDTLSGGLNGNCAIDYNTIDLVELDAIVNSDTTVIIHWTVYQTDGSVTDIYDTLNYGGAGAYYFVEAIYYCPEKSVGQYAGFQGTIYIPSFEELGIGEQAVEGLKVYPNPFESSVVISFDKAGTYELTLTDASGRKLLSQQAADKSEIETASLHSGIYFVTVSNGNERSVVKIIKK